MVAEPGMLRETFRVATQPEQEPERTTVQDWARLAKRLLRKAHVRRLWSWLGRHLAIVKEHERSVRAEIYGRSGTVELASSSTRGIADGNATNRRTESGHSNKNSAECRDQHVDSLV
eukprot:6491364-Amphidinium_carterae.5